MQRLAADRDNLGIVDCERRQPIADQRIGLAVEQPAVIGALDLGLLERAVGKKGKRGVSFR